jgi:hypothetical protein
LLFIIPALLFFAPVAHEVKIKHSNNNKNLSSDAPPAEAVGFFNDCVIPVRMQAHSSPAVCFANGSIPCRGIKPIDLAEFIYLAFLDVPPILCGWKQKKRCGPSFLPQEILVSGVFKIPQFTASEKIITKLIISVKCR